MLPRQVLLTFLVPVVLVLAGMVGFHLLEGLSLFDSLYLTVITLTTVGYGDVHPRTPAGRVFTIALVLTGVFVVFYAMTALIRVIVSGELRATFGKRHMERALALLKDHIIVCGYGHMGRFVCREFSRAGLAFVVIDTDAEAVRDFQLPGGLALVGDATSDEVLRHAGIEQARAIVTVMSSDADNLFTTMSARLLNSKVFIVARMEDAQAEKKLLRAGANRVVSPYQIGGNRMAQAVLRPTVVDFIDLATQKEHIELQMEEAAIVPQSSLANTKLRDCRLLADLRVLVVAIKKSGGHMLFNPKGDTALEAGDILVAIGPQEQLDKLSEHASKAAPATS